MKFILLLATYFVLALPAFSQGAGSQPIAYYYFDKNWEQLPGDQGAAYVRVFMGLDAIRTRYEVREYTISGTLLSSSYSSSRYFVTMDGPITWYNNKRTPSTKGQHDHGLPTGQWTEYYYNGQMKEQYSYHKTETQEGPSDPFENFTIDNSWDSTGQVEVKDGNGLYRDRDDTTGAVLQQGMVKNGRREGTWQGFYKDGQPMYEEEYTDGKLVKGTRFVPGGEPVVYDKLAEPPVYPGGDKSLAKFLGKTLRYPRSAQEMGISGTVLVKFMVEADGSMTGIAIDAGVDRSLNDESLRVVKLMSKWTPGKRRGVTEAIPVRLPLRFTLVQ